MKIMIGSIVALAGMLVAMGCRTAKPKEERMAVDDCIRVNVESTVSASVDSIFWEEENGHWTIDAVEFVEGGGIVGVSADGSVAMRGVTSVRNTRRDSVRIVRDSLTRKSVGHLKDSVETTHHFAANMVTKDSGSILSGGWIVKCGIGVGVALLIIIMAYRIWRDLKR